MEWKFPSCARGRGAIQAAITLSDNDMIGSGASKVKTNSDTGKSRKKQEAGPGAGYKDSSAGAKAG